MDHPVCMSKCRKQTRDAISSAVVNIHRHVPLSSGIKKSPTVFTLLLEKQQLPAKKLCRHYELYYVRQTCVDQLTSVNDSDCLAFSNSTALANCVGKGMPGPVSNRKLDVAFNTAYLCPPQRGAVLNV